MNKNTIKVQTFFIEHPMHSFTVKSISEYLNIPERDVISVITYLLLDQSIIRKYQYKD